MFAFFSSCTVCRGGCSQNYQYKLLMSLNGNFSHQYTGKQLHTHILALFQGPIGDTLAWCHQLGLGIRLHGHTQPQCLAKRTSSSRTCSCDLPKLVVDTGALTTGLVLKIGHTQTITQCWQYCELFCNYKDNSTTQRISEHWQS